MAYIGGALTNVPPEVRTYLTEIYENAAELVRNFGYFAYVPHRYSDPVKHANLTITQVDRFDRMAVTLSYLVVLYIGEKAFGPAIELEIANHANKPVILICEDGRIDKGEISRLIRGNPAVRTIIEFGGINSLRVQLRRELALFREHIRSQNLPEPLSI